MRGRSQFNNLLVKFPFMTIYGIPYAFTFRLHIFFLSFLSCKNMRGAHTVQVSFLWL